MQILDQPFDYLARGAQAYVFASRDGKTVIKFFRVYHLMPPLWMTCLNFPLPLQPYKIAKMIRKREGLKRDFQSYKIAFEELKEETGVLYVHLNKSDDLKKKLIIHDKIGIAHEVDLDRMEFIVQKKSLLVLPLHRASLSRRKASRAQKGRSAHSSSSSERAAKRAFTIRTPIY